MTSKGDSFVIFVLESDGGELVIPVLCPNGSTRLAAVYSRPDYVEYNFYTCSINSFIPA